MYQNIYNFKCGNVLFVRMNIRCGCETHINTTNVNLSKRVCVMFIVKNKMKGTHMCYRDVQIRAGETAPVKS